MLEKRIYLDVCVLCRPFDDQQQARIRLETNALSLILAKVREANLHCIISQGHDAEINAIRDAEERHYLNFLLEQLGTRPKSDRLIVRQRAEELVDGGMGIADAAHVAFAEFAQADSINKLPCRSTSRSIAPSSAPISRAPYSMTFASAALWSGT